MSFKKHLNSCFKQHVFIHSTEVASEMTPMSFAILIPSIHSLFGLGMLNLCTWQFVLGTPTQEKSSLEKKHM